MKLAAVIIWYNPQKVESCIQRILSYARHVKAYIVDNSPIDNSELAKQVPDSVYIPNLKNLGIAAAQNIGCTKAYEDGFEWVITMDQDSFFEDVQIERYLKEADRYSLSDEKAVSFSLSRIDDSKKILPVSLLVRKYIKSFLVKYFDYSPPHRNPQTTEPIDHPDIVIASGNIIKLSAWEEVGKFDESLFIDEVDFDFCIRLILGGYYITRFNTLYLNHKLGNRRLTLFPKNTYHSGKRLFFIIRNKLIENRRYRYALKLNRDYKKEISRYVKDYCILDLKAPYYWIVFTRAYFAYRAFIKSDPVFLKLKQEGLAK